VNKLYPLIILCTPLYCARYSPPPQKGTKEYIEERKEVKRTLNAATKSRKDKVRRIKNN